MSPHTILPARECQGESGELLWRKCNAFCRLSTIGLPHSRHLIYTRFHATAACLRETAERRCQLKEVIPSW